MGWTEVTLKTNIPRSKYSRNLSRLTTFLIIGGLLLFLAVQIRRAWLSDDAFITFRTIDNMINGFGLTWNIQERVQTYTHPLWMFLLLAFSWVTSELLLTTLVLSIILSLASVIILIFRLAVSPLTGFFGLTILILSNAFIDFSTSGLENPLAYFLIITFSWIYFTRETNIHKLFWLSLVTSLGMLTRLDLAFILWPALLFEWIKFRHWKGGLALAIGQIPLLLWEIFSIFYYGFAFPNTAYAKLNTGIPDPALAYQGILYFIDSVQADALTMIVIASSLVLALFAKDKRSAPIAIGIILYLIYIIRIGGDFMSGRFFAVPLLCAVVILTRFDISTLPATLKFVLFSSMIVLGLLSPTPTLFFTEVDLTAQERSSMVNDQKIVNERQFYSWTNSLLRIDPLEPVVDHPWAIDGREVKDSGRKIASRITVGMFGYYAGPQVYVLDQLALGDPLLARLPAMYDPEWRIGHFRRTIPDGYINTLESGINQLADSQLRDYYERIRVITRGGILEPQRLAEIWKINTGKYQSLIDFDYYRHPKLQAFDYNDIINSQSQWSGLHEFEPVSFDQNGLEIGFHTPQYASEFHIEIDSGFEYQFIYLRDQKQIAEQRINIPESFIETTESCIKMPGKADQTGIDAIRIFPIARNREFTLQNFQVGECRLK